MYAATISVMIDWVMPSTHPLLIFLLRFSPVRACLFDMDGLLIDSEDIYTLCNNIILHQYGRPSLPWNIKAQLQGRPGPEVRLLLFYQLLSSLKSSV